VPGSPLRLPRAAIGPAGRRPTAPQTHVQPDLRAFQNCRFARRLDGWPRQDRNSTFGALLREHPGETPRPWILET